MGEALSHGDIDWYRLTMNHKYIYLRLKNSLEEIIKNSGLNMQFIPQLMTPDMFKNAVFDRVMNNGQRFTLRHGATDIISFIIVSPYTSNVQKLSKLIEFHREWLNRDDLRIRQKMIVDECIIYLYGTTEFGTIYEIKLIPSLLHEWSVWYLKQGFKNPQYADQLYKETLKNQKNLDNTIVYS